MNIFLKTLIANMTLESRDRESLESEIKKRSGFLFPPELSALNVVSEQTQALDLKSIFFSEVRPLG